MPSNFRRVFTSSVGTKLLIGLTGLALFAYLVLHLAGNALIFLGPDTFNEYSHSLISNPLVVPVEIGLLLIFLLHVYKTITMYVAEPGGAARCGMQKKAMAGHTSRKSLASSTMIVTGSLTLLFVLVHVKQFKYGAYYAAAATRRSRSLPDRGRGLQPAGCGWPSTSSAWPLVGCTCGTASRAASSRIGLITRVYTRRLVTWGIVAAVVDRRRSRVIPLWVYLTTEARPARLRCTLGTRPRFPAARSPRSGTATGSRSKLVNPANRRKYTIIIVGTGLAGASAAASLGELGYNVLSFCIQDSPRRAHSIAAQGGINAAKNYQNDGDSIYRLFYDTVKGGDYRVARSERLPAGAAQRQHHRPVRRAGRAVRARVRRPARQPIVRRRPGVAHVLRARPDRPAAAARRVSVDDAAGRARHGQAPSPTARCSTWSSSTARRAASSSATWSPARSSATRATRCCSAPAATARPITCRPTP